jgi:hypothetical protein
MKKFLLAVVATGLVAVAVPAAADASSSCYYSARGCVSVGGYFKPSTGTYVKPYVRNYPGYRGYTLPSYRSYRAPSYRSYYYGY